MKKFIGVVIFLYSFVSVDNVFAQSNVNIEPLVKTSWDQVGDYALFSPDNQRLGCWSVALAQMLFFYGLVPSGQTSYIGRHYTVSADFDNPSVNLKNVSTKLDSSVPEINKTETARYLWYVALVTGKDFNTGNYIGNSDVRRERLNRYCGVKTTRIQYPESNKNQVEQFIITELSANRPLLLYIQSTEKSTEEDSAHAVVIDGIRKRRNTTLVHLNFGWGGRADGWYDLWKQIERFNHNDRWIMSLRQ
jgi:hypothetical protein